MFIAILPQKYKTFSYVLRNLSLLNNNYKSLMILLPILTKLLFNFKKNKSVMYTESEICELYREMLQP